jgi:hypothetical protein
LYVARASSVTAAVSRPAFPRDGFEWPGEPADIDLAASGSLGGRLHLFGAVPPITITGGSWCWVQARSQLVLEVQTESVEDVIVEARVVLIVAAIEPNRIAGSEGDEKFELIRSPW